MARWTCSARTKQRITGLLQEFQPAEQRCSRIESKRASPEGLCLTSEPGEQRERISKDVCGKISGSTNRPTAPIAVRFVSLLQRLIRGDDAKSKKSREQICNTFMVGFVT